MNRRWRRFVMACLFAGTALTVSACGDRSVSLPRTGATLEGTVQYGDESVLFALIIVQAGGSSATGKIDDEGKYTVDNVPVGEVTIAVNTAAGQGDYMTKSMSGSYKGPTASVKDKGKNTAPKYVKVPEKYHEPATSPLKTTINKGANTHDIKIPK